MKLSIFHPVATFFLVQALLIIVAFASGVDFTSDADWFYANLLALPTLAAALHGLWGRVLSKIAAPDSPDQFRSIYLTFGVTLVSGLGAGIYLTDWYHTKQEVASFVNSQRDLVCESRVKTIDSPSQYLIYETGNEGDCEKVIEYTDAIPDDFEYIRLDKVSP